MVVDEMAGAILEFIPLYHFGKVCFLIYLFNPSTKGASMIYKKVIHPLLKQHKAKIDAILKEIHSIANEAKEAVNSKKDD